MIKINRLLNERNRKEYKLVVGFKIGPKNILLT